MFKVIVVGGPCEKWINKCLDSILAQKGVDFEVLISLDQFDSAQQKVMPYVGNNVKMRLNTDQIGGLGNIVRAMELSTFNDADIICFMDGDDWLLGSDALATVHRTYTEHPTTLVTHGGWVSNMGTGYDDCKATTPYTEDEFNNIRSAAWKGTQLKTMRYRVFKAIDKNDLRDSNGAFRWRAGDHALMFPALEMAGYDRTQCITDKIYSYNRKDRTVTAEGQIDPVHDVAQVRSQPPYTRLTW